MSASDPAVSSSAASISEYASTIHCREEKLGFSALEIEGSATETIVMSSSNMNVVAVTTASVHHLRFPDSAPSSFAGCVMTSRTAETCGGRTWAADPSQSGHA